MIVLPTILFLLWNRIPYAPLKVGIGFGVFFTELVLVR